MRNENKVRLRTDQQTDITLTAGAAAAGVQTQRGKRAGWKGRAGKGGGEGRVRNVAERHKRHRRRLISPTATT